MTDDNPAAEVRPGSTENRSSAPKTARSLRSRLWAASRAGPGSSEACLRWRADADAGMGCRGSIVNAVPLRILQEKGGDRGEPEVVTR